MGATTLCWAIWLSRNDVVFNRTSTNFFLQAVFRGSYWIRDWSLLFKEEERNELKERMQDSGDYCHGTFQQLRLEIQL